VLVAPGFLRMVGNQEVRQTGVWVPSMTPSPRRFRNEWLIFDDLEGILRHGEEAGAGIVQEATRRRFAGVAEAIE
jgi:hypothetical protein